MTIPNDIKAKVLANYLGHQIITAGGDLKTTLEGITRSEVDGNQFICIQSNNHGSQHGFPEDFVQDCKLILRPYTALTDKEKHEMASIIGTLRVDFFLECLYKGFTYSLSSHKTIQAYQYLQSIGIDLPNYYLDGQTLKEAGLAVYDET